jgi:crotonobetainyl-CoA:carnitine CoA-transferase CaiB-like acyl-CoA transferase
VYDTAVEFGAPMSYVAEPPDILANPDIARTGVWRTVAHPVTGWLRVPGPPFRSDDMAFDFTPAPSLGEHTAGVLADVIGLSQDGLGLLTAQAGAASRDGATNAEAPAQGGTA